MCTFFFNECQHLLHAVLYLAFFFFFFASKQLSLLFAQGQLLQALRPQDFQKGWG